MPTFSLGSSEPTFHESATVVGASKSASEPRSATRSTAAAAGTRSDQGSQRSQHSPQRQFYRWQFVCTALFWLQFRRRTGKHLWEIANGAVCTRPSWLPTAPLLALHRLRVPVFVLMPLMMAMSSLGSLSGSRPLRLLTALVTSAYHLIESSVTNRHGEFPMLYNSWAMLLPDPYAQAASLGVAVNFVLSSGIAKLQVGGLGWMRPRTMRAYLDIYAASRSAPPLSPTLNRFLARRDWATGAIGVGTILLECGLIPATLLMPAPWRRVVGVGAMVAMHCGIGVAMSAQVGLLFLTALPSYISGFSCEAAVGSGPWVVAACAGLGPSLLSALGLPTGESWPLSPVQLFMWSGGAARALQQALMTGGTRAVLGSAAVVSSAAGLPVVPTGVPAARVAALLARSKQPAALHDALTRVIGFTTCQGSLAGAALTLRRAPSGGWLAQPFIEAVQKWLVEERRLVEMHTGRALVQAFFVRVHNGIAL
jgi:hypothetical protein